jgi:cytidylate kinase
MDRLIIAIDGPAASGKGTLARRIAAHYGLRHLDTGLTYRAVAAELLRRGLSVDDEQAALECAGSVDLAALDRNDLSRHEIGEAASRVAVLPALRRAVVEIQRAFAEKPPGAVLDGRDIGTVVCPDAAVKLYISASPEERARRRTEEIRSRGGDADYAGVLEDLRRRDERDLNRAESPLRVAEGAIVLDTTDIGIDAAFQAARAIIDRAVSGQATGA